MSLNVNGDNCTTISEQLPYGFTILKLREVHSSDSTNLVIAHLLFLAGYIEHLGAGTTDMISDYQEYALRAPDG